MYNVNSKLQLYQEEKSGDTSQRLKKNGTINVDFSGRGQEHLSWFNVTLGLLPTAPHPCPQDQGEDSKWT